MRPRVRGAGRTPLWAAAGVGAQVRRGAAGPKSPWSRLDRVSGARDALRQGISRWQMEPAPGARPRAGGLHRRRHHSRPCWRPFGNRCPGQTNCGDRWSRMPPPRADGRGWWRWRPGRHVTHAEIPVGASTGPASTPPARKARPVRVRRAQARPGNPASGRAADRPAIPVRAERGGVGAGRLGSVVAEFR